jgi:hypothetical protein
LEGHFSDPLKFENGFPADQPRPRSTENFFQPGPNCAPRRDGAAMAIKKAVELNSNVPVRDERNKEQESLEVKV